MAVKSGFTTGGLTNFFSSFFRKALPGGSKLFSEWGEKIVPRFSGRSDELFFRPPSMGDHGSPRVELPGGGRFLPLTEKKNKVVLFDEILRNPKVSFRVRGRVSVGGWQSKVGLPPVV